MFDKNTLSRRGILSPLIAVPTITLAAPIIVSAKTEQKPEAGLVSPEKVQTLLNKVPTFTIVDKEGVPFMVVGEDAKITAYFFTTYGETKRILDLARTSTDKAIKVGKEEAKRKNPGSENEIGPNPWNNAQIMSVPLGFAVTMASKSTAAAYFRVAPADDDVNDALKIIKKDGLAEGKVPLFYYKDFTIDENGEKLSPLYFRKSELLQAWNYANGKVDPPQMEVTELFSVLKEMTKSGGKDSELKRLVFIPPEESEKKMKEIKSIPFQLGKRNLVL